MIYEIDKYTEVLITLKITPNQFYLCWLLYTKDETNLQKYLQEHKFTSAEIKDLINKDVLITVNRTAEMYNTNNLYVNGQFVDAVLIDDETAFDEIIGAYPSYLIVQGKKVATKGLTFSDESLMREYYAKLIKKNRFLHARILAAIGRYKEQNDGFASMKIDKFITSKHWEQITDEDDRAKPDIY